jgi:hypothetical protein
VSAQAQIKILFLAANPQDITRLQIDEEMRAIDQALRMTEYRDRFDLRSHWAVRYSDLQELFLRYRPHIVHFSGHGSPVGEIILQSEHGIHPVSAKALSSLFSILKDNIHCVVLNACYSEVQAAAIAEHIDCVIGMSDAIGDTASINFAAAFYRALGYRRSVKAAFDLGCNEISLANLPDKDIPHLLAAHSDPAQVTFVTPEEGAAVRDAAPAPGERTVSAGHDINSSVIITGDNVVYYGSVETLNIASAVFLAPPPGGQVEPKVLLWTYLNQVVADTATLDLAGVARQTAHDPHPMRLNLAAIYTELSIWQTAEVAGDDDQQQAVPAGHMEAYESALAFVDRTRYAVLLGDPGSGKTTFANFLTLCLAGELLGLDQANLARLGQEWTAGALLPVHIVLRTFSAWLGENRTQRPGDLLWSYIVHRMGQSLTEFADLLKKHLLEEGGLLVLDGLDEAPGSHDREICKTALLAFRRQFPRVRMLLTGRTYSYLHQNWRLPGFADALLTPLNDQQIDRFIDRWYAYRDRALTRAEIGESKAGANLLKQNIRRSRRLRELASQPLLLTLMVTLHTRYGSGLPEQCEDLYGASVNLLLEWWERSKQAVDQNDQLLMQTVSAAEWFQIPPERIEQALEELAFLVHRDQVAQTNRAKIAESQVVAALLKAAGPDTRPARVIEYIRERTGLLVNRGVGIYSFLHRTFQEYMAARYLARTGFPKQLVELAAEDLVRWREVVLLAAVRVARSEADRAWALADRLCPYPYHVEQVNAATDQTGQLAILAGQVLTETGVHKMAALDAVERQILARVVTWLVNLLDLNYLPSVDRTAAGAALGRLGDPRAGVGLRQDGVPDILWVRLDGKRIPSRSQVSLPNQITTPYAISRYPVTVSQYQAFIDAGGYARLDYWTQAGWAWRQAAGVTSPQTYTHIFQTSNHPQVGVSWYEAVAFCNWLSAQLGQRIALPTEPQWEYAARHPDDRFYPWGEAFIPSVCNMRDTNIGHTSAVGIFPAGDAACGAADMAGNVWEWCRTCWRSDSAAYTPAVDDDLARGERRVLRGGSFTNERRLLRTTQRHRNHPDHRALNVGFRVVAL